MANVAEVGRPIVTARSRRSFLSKMLGNSEFWRGLVAIIVFLCLWELGARSKQLFGYALPYVGLLPAPSEVAVAWSKVLTKSGYWQSWYQSFQRVLLGFAAAQLIGIPFGLMLAVNRYFREIFFPPFEVLRPIPPLAWVPASLIFWPTNEMSIAFVTFLGAFFTIVINVLGGARTIDVRYLRAAQSMGASQWHLFWRIILPGHTAFDLHWRGGGHGHHLGSGGCRRDDLGRRHTGRRRARLLHMELLHGRLAAADRRRHDLDRHCRLFVEQRHPLAGRSCHALAASVLMDR